MARHSLTRPCGKRDSSVHKVSLAQSANLTFFSVDEKLDKAKLHLSDPEKEKLLKLVETYEACHSRTRHDVHQLEELKKRCNPYSELDEGFFASLTGL